MWACRSDSALVLLPVTNCALLFAVPPLLAHVEARHCPVLSAEKQHSASTAVSAPAAKCCALVDVPNSGKRLLVGRQCCVIFAALLIARIACCPRPAAGCRRC